MIAVAVGAVAVTALICMAAVILIGKPEPEGRHAAAKPPPGIRIKADATQALAVLAEVRERLNGLRPEKASDGDELWVDGLAVPDPEPPPAQHEGPVFGPHPPARRPRLAASVATVARVRTAAIIRAIPLDAIPWLKHGQGYSDHTGGFEALAAPALHADESISMTRTAMAKGLAEQHAKEWGL